MWRHMVPHGAKYDSIAISAFTWTIPAAQSRLRTLPAARGAT
jgi:hypothetical protein